MRATVASAAGRRRLVRRLRWVLLLLCLGAAWFGLRGLSVVRLPEGPSPLADYGPGTLLLVRRLPPEEDVAVGEAVVYRHAGGLAVGRVAALPGDEVEVDASSHRARRRPDGPWVVVSDALEGRLRGRVGGFLVASEDPMARSACAVVDRGDLVAVVVGALPF